MEGQQKVAEGHITANYSGGVKTSFISNSQVLKLLQVLYKRITGSVLQLSDAAARIRNGSKRFQKENGNGILITRGWFDP